MSTHGLVNIECQQNGQHKLYNITGPTSNKPVILTLRNIQIRNCKPNSNDTSYGVITGNNGHVKISNGNFVNNGLLFYHQQDMGSKCTNFIIYVTNSSFATNLISQPYLAGISLLGCDTLDITLQNTAMKTTAIKLQAFRNMSVHFYNVSMDGQSLRSSLLHITLTESTTISVSNCTFHSLLSGHDSAVVLSINKPSNFTPNIHLNQVDFLNNRMATGKGAALSLFSRFSQSGTEKNYDINTELKQCKFSNNSAVVDGGAIYVRGVHQVQINQCIFLNNTGYNGGAIYVDTVSDLAVVNSQFVANLATKDQNTIAQGGALFCQQSTVSIDNCSFIGNAADFSPSTLFITQAPTFSIQQSYFESLGSQEVMAHSNMIQLQSANPPTTEPNAIINNNIFNITNVSEITIFEAEGHVSLKKNKYFCPKGLNISEIGKNAAMADKFNFYKVVYWCKECPYGYYIPSDHSDNKHRNPIEECQQCPKHALCEHGQARARSNYWGRVRLAENESSHKVVMVLCPPRRCCQGQQCRALDSCPPLMEGPLCSQCITNHTMHMTRTTCVHNDQCMSIGWAVLLSLAVCIGALVLWVLIAKVVLILTKDPSENRGEDDALLDSNSIGDIGSVQIDRPVLLAEDDDHDLDDNLIPINPQHSSSGIDKSRLDAVRNLIGSLTVLFFYCQLAPVIYIPISPETTYRSEISEVISAVAKFRFPFALLVEVCSLGDLGLVGRTLFGLIESWMLWAITVFLPLAILGCMKCRSQSSTMSQKLATVYMYFGTILSCLILGVYIPTTTDYLKFLRCIDYDNKSLLYQDASVLCESTWQVPIIIYIFGFVASFGVALCHGTTLLRHCSISYPQFFISVFFPLPALIVWYIQFRPSLLWHKLGHRYNVNDDIVGELQNENVRLSPGARAALVVFHGPYQGYRSRWYHFHWSAVLITQAFTILVASSQLSHTPIAKSFTVMLIVFTYLAVHVAVRPFASNFVNRLQTMLMIFLCVLTVTSLYTAMMYADDITRTNTTDRLLVVSEWIYNVLLVFPIVAVASIGLVVLVKLCWTKAS